MKQKIIKEQMILNFIKTIEEVIVNIRRIEMM